MNRNLGRQFHRFDVEAKPKDVLHGTEKPRATHRIVVSGDYPEETAHLIATQMALCSVPHREIGDVTLRV